MINLLFINRIQPAMKFFIFIIFLYFAANFYVFRRIWLVMPSSQIGKICLVAFAIIVIGSLIVTFLWGESLPIMLTTITYKIGTSWLFIFIYVFLVNLIGTLIRLTHLVPIDKMNHYTRDNWLVFLLVFAFIFLLMLCGYLKYRTKDRVELPISIEKNMCENKPLRIVAISDLHLGYNIGADELQEWIGLINAENPDIVLIAGDIIDSSLRPVNNANLAKYFKEVKSKYGIYSILGNHEYLSGVSGSEKFFKEAGINLLKDQSVLIDSCFYIVGRDDKSNPSRKPLEELTINLDKSKPIILLDHQPYNLEEAEANGIDLQFSGHTHRGQVWPISLITDYIYEDSYGYLKKGNTNVYVSSGIGLWGGKFRIGTQSEYVVIEMKGK